MGQGSILQGKRKSLVGLQIFKYEDRESERLNIWSVLGEASSQKRWVIPWSWPQRQIQSGVKASVPLAGPVIAELQGQVLKLVSYVFKSLLKITILL